MKDSKKNYRMILWESARTWSVNSRFFACLKGRICRVVVLGISFFDATEDGLRENLCLKHPTQIRPS